MSRNRRRGARQDITLAAVAGRTLCDGGSMLQQLVHNDLAQAILDAQNSPYWARARRLLPLMLALWMSYFLVVNWFVHSLNKIALLGAPLGTCLAVQGALVMFAVTLFRFARGAE